MAGGAVRGAAAAWLGLIVLDGLLTNRGAQATTGVLSFAASVVNRALSPDVALVPDFSKGGSTDGGTSPVVTGQASSDGSSGHNYDIPVSAPAPSPVPARTGNPSPIPINGHPVPS